PRCASPTAILAVKVDFPTPPLPEATAKTLVKEDSPNGFFGRFAVNCSCNATRCGGVITDNTTATLPSTTGARAFTTSVSIVERIGQPWMVNRMVTVTWSWSTSTRATMPKVVTG